MGCTYRMNRTAFGIFVELCVPGGTFKCIAFCPRPMTNTSR